MAAANLPKGSVALQVGLDSVVMAVEAAAALGAEPAAALEAHGEWGVLAAWLAAARSAEPAPVPYVAGLPTSTGGCLEWARTEAAELLAGSPAAREAEARRDSVTKAAPALLAAFPERLSRCGAEDLRWAYSMLFSRLVRLDDLDGGALALVPWADLLNTRPGAGAFLTYDAALRSVVLRPERAYAEGEQVFVSYGERSSAEYLLSYGFVPPAGNPHESVDVAVALQRSDPQRAAKGAALARRGLQAGAVFPVRIDAVPAEMLAFAAFAATPVAGEAEAERLAAEAFDGGAGGGGLLGGPLGRKKRGVPGGEDGEAAGRELLVALLSRQQQGYTRPLAEDRKLAEAAAEAGASALTRQGRATCAAAVRWRERTILARAEAELRAAQRESGVQAVRL